ncbi:hypothetical protein A4X13_0g5101 [Tilletia indica]|uniref:Uncharacterized protein n=1 Tax=Tilletia indica TaxID=43049 RepID=A0A177T887_9BASI|nr:hypothetical protein A4X13_0g5101 [Tilletia indica]
MPCTETNLSAKRSAFGRSPIIEQRKGNAGTADGDEHQAMSAGHKTPLMRPSAANGDDEADQLTPKFNKERSHRASTDHDRTKHPRRQSARSSLLGPQRANSEAPSVPPKRLQSAWSIVPNKC